MFGKWALLGALVGAIQLTAGIEPSYSATISETCVRSGQIDPAVSSEFEAFPDGGAALAERLRALVVADPELAQDITILAEAQGSTEQQVAAAQAIAHAQLILTWRDDPHARRVFAWVGCTRAKFRLVYVNHQSSLRVGTTLKSGFQAGNHPSGTTTPSTFIP